MVIVWDGVIKPVPRCLWSVAWCSIVVTEAATFELVR